MISASTSTKQATAAKNKTTTTTRMGRAVVTAVGVGLGLVVACSVNVDVNNKACASDGACAPGYTCNQTKICVLSQDYKPDLVDSGGGTGDGAVTPPTCDPCPCTSDTDCKEPKPRCSPTTKTCVECMTTPTDNCRAGSYCNALNQCTLGCKEENDCLVTAPGTHCDATRHQCVECTTAFPCKDAAKKCSPSGFCALSCSTTAPVVPCANSAETCCDGLCLNVQTDVLNCGGCGTRCVEKNGTAKCAGAACTWTCAIGFTHCDNGNTGCETTTGTDPAHCGSCTKNCDALRTNSTGIVCAGGACNYTACLPNFSDRDNNRTNGCEFTCGKTGQPCCPPNDFCETSCNTGKNECK